MSENQKMLFCRALKLVAFTLLLLISATGALAQKSPSLADAQAFIDKAEAELLTLSNEAQQAGWVQETFITQDTEAMAAKANERLIARTTELVMQSKHFESLPLPGDLRRKFLLLKLSLGLPAPSDPKLRTEVTQIASAMDGSYGAGKYCGGTNPSKCVGIDDLEVRMAQSRNPKELADMWVGWHKIGVPMRDRYARFVELSNEGARELGFADTGVIWRSGYDMSAEAFSADLERLWTQVEPLYRELHAYVRRRLIEKYGAVA